MPEKAALWILGIEVVALALFLVMQAVTHFRDLLIDRGFLPTHWWIVRMALAADRQKTWRTLKEIGFRDDHFLAVAQGLDTVRAKNAQQTGTLLSRRLLLALKSSTVELPRGFSYKNSGQYYIDTMGAMSFSSNAFASLAVLLDDWVSTLESAGLIPPFDAVLTLKEGNVTMVRQFLMLNSPTGGRIGILCKGREDKSRVKRATPTPHETDFEGLRALFDEKRNPDRPLSIIAVDDNCTGGSSLCYALSSFNDLIKSRNYQIHPVRHAVVLFTVKSDDTERNFRDSGFELHSVLSLGGTEMAQIRKMQSKEIERFDTSAFKRGFGCQSSIKLEV